jgi:hypothetical protein
MSTTSSSDLGIPDPVLQSFKKNFERLIRPDDSNEYLNGCVGSIWFMVHEILSGNQDLAKVFATEEVCKENIQKLGEESSVVY